MRLNVSKIILLGTFRRIKRKIFKSNTSFIKNIVEKKADVRQTDVSYFRLCFHPLS